MTTKAMPIPEGLDVIQINEQAVIRRRWFSHVVWFLVFFCIVWDAMLISWYVSALTGGHRGSSDFMAIFFPLGHVAVGFGLTYFVIGMFLNKTDVILSEQVLEVKTHPLFWPGNKVLPASELTAISYRIRQGNGRNGRVTYDVMYVDSTNRERTLLRGLPKEEQAEYIANSLDRFYHPVEETF